MPLQRPISSPGSRRLPRTASALPVLFAVACLTGGSGARAQEAKDGQAKPGRPLAHFAAMHVIVLPTQFLGQADSAGLGASIASPREFLAGLDNEIAFAIKDRIRTSWVWPDALVRAAKMNPTYGSDPYALPSDELRPRVPHKNPEIGQSLASELRTMIAFQDDARYALVPVELRFEPLRYVPPADGRDTRSAKDSAAAAVTTMRALLRVALIDCRASRIVFAVDIPSDTLSKVTPAVSAQIASRLADLIAPGEP